MGPLSGTLKCYISIPHGPPYLGHQNVTWAHHMDPLSGTPKCYISIPHGPAIWDTKMLHQHTTWAPCLGHQNVTSAHHMGPLSGTLKCYISTPHGPPIWDTKMLDYTLGGIGRSEKVWLAHLCKCWHLWMATKCFIWCPYVYLSWLGTITNVIPPSGVPHNTSSWRPSLRHMGRTSLLGTYISDNSHIQFPLLANVRP